MKELQISLRKKLYLVTTNYPNSGGDSVFVLPEIPELKKRFDLTVLCTSGKGDCENKEDGIKYFFYEQSLSPLKKIKYILIYPFCKQCREDFLIIWKKHKTEKKNDLLGRLRKSIEFYACGEEFYHWFEKNVSSDAERKNVIFYTFWCNAYSLPLVIHSKKYSNYRLITRLQGYDLYEERYLYGRQPFKEVINCGLDKLFFVAKRPMQYYLEKHPELDTNKVKMVRLGVYGINHNGKNDNSVCYRQEATRNVTMLLVSCSNLIPLKRVPLIVEALALLDEPIHWIHFGGGEGMSALLEQADEMLGKKGNITYTLKGNTPNDQIRRFYQENHVDCFITVSSTEGGSPVSIMEAMAAGVPVIGTDVGDISFMIQGNGILLNVDPTVEEIAEAIRGMAHASERKLEDMRKRSFGLWSEFFDAEKNSVQFANEVEKLLTE